MLFLLLILLVFSLVYLVIHYGDVLRVSYEVDDVFFLSGLSNKFVYKLHPNLATKGSTSGACGLVAFLFAQKTLMDPQPYRYKIFPGDFEHTMLYINKYTQVADTLREGQAMYTANFGESGCWMKPQDITLLISHVGFAAENSEVGSMELLAKKIIALKPKEVMLLFQIEKQRVWSVVNCSLVGQWMVIYSCQPHSCGADQQYGGIIYCFTKAWLNIIHILTLMENHSGVSLKGLSHILLFKKQI